VEVGLLDLVERQLPSSKAKVLLLFSKKQSSFSDSFTLNSAREGNLTLKGGFTLCPRLRSFFLKEFGEHLICLIYIGAHN